MSDDDNQIWGAPVNSLSVKLKPNERAIRDHILWLIKPVIHTEYRDAQFEIASHFPDQGMQARLFILDEVDEAVAYAVTENLKGKNVYIGATLKDPDADPYSRTDISDFYVATAVPADVDENYNAVMERMAATIGHSELTVVTGTKPERRSHHWFRLAQVCSDNVEFKTIFETLVYGIGADKAVKDPARLMRLGGTISYPSQKKKDRGYNVELTTVIFQKGVDPLRESQILALEPVNFESTGRAVTVANRAQVDGEIVKDGFGKVVDGREQWFRNLVFAMIAMFQEQNGCDPRPDDIAQEAFRIFAQRCDTSDGRWTPNKLMRRINNTFRRFDAGHLSLKPIGQPRPAEAPPFQWGERLAAQAVGPQIKRDTNPDAANTTIVPKLKTLEELFVEYKPPHYLIEGILQKGYLYTPTGRSGSGKTVAAIRIGMDVAAGNPVGTFATEQCNVAFFAGENPALVTNRLIILCEKMGWDPKAIPFFTYSDTFKLDVGFDRVIEDADRIGGFGLIIVDTFSAYCRENGIEENDNNAMGKWVKDVLRKLSQLPGNPCIVALSHPNRSSGKNPATKDDLIPRGAYATLGEVDGNITVWREGNVIEIEAHAEKFRGAPFGALKMKMISALSDKYRDTKGKPLNEIYADYVTDDEIEREEDRQENTDITILRGMEDYFHDMDEWPSSRQLGARVGLSHQSISGRQKFLATAKGMKLVAKARRSQTAPYKLTDAGMDYLRELAAEAKDKFTIET